MCKLLLIPHASVLIHDLSGVGLQAFEEPDELNPEAEPAEPAEPAPEPDADNTVSADSYDLTGAFSELHCTDAQRVTQVALAL